MLTRIAIVCLVILSFFGRVFASDIQWNGTLSQLWDVADNWDLARVPDTGDRAILSNMPGPVIDSSTTAAVNTVTIGGAGGVLEISGGTLITNARIDIGYDACTTGTLTIDSGTVTTNSDLNVGYDGSGTIIMNGGALNINGTLSVAYGGNAVGQIYLYGGTLNCTDIVMAPWDGTAAIDITEGTLIIDGNKISTINSYVNITGWITAYGGAGTVVFDYNITNPGKTTVTISKAAKKPDPVSGAFNVPLDKILHWTTVPGTTHDLYFGTDINEVNDANDALFIEGSLAGDLDSDGLVDYNDLHILTNYWLMDPTGSEPYAGVNNDIIVDFIDYAILANNWNLTVQASPNPLYMGNLDVNSFDPNLASLTTYYWRVDEVVDGEKLKGNIWNFTTMDTNYSLVGKVMCGYQGWFNCTGDGTTRNWRHWTRSGTNAPTPTNVHVDMWPDMNEMDSDEKFAASAFNDSNGVHYLFSSHNQKTVQRHFKWMQDYCIDGAFVQRFAVEIKNQGSSDFTNRNEIFDYCKTAANMYGRKYSVMYDLSGLGTGETSYVINDWKYLVDNKHVTLDPNYTHHRGKPVVTVWGIGFKDRDYTLAECLTLVNFLRNDPVYGGNTVMVGLPSYWRQHDGTKDCVNDPCVEAIAKAADIVSPWSVGRYRLTSEVSTYASDVWIKDLQWCDQNSTPTHPIEYMPVIFPGYSFHNATVNDSPPKIINEFPRNGGQFLWDQVYYATHVASVKSLYVAMFDEVDEGTAIFKVSNSPPTGAPFVTYRQEGRGGGQGVLPSGALLPNDEYLWLTQQAGMALRLEIPQTSTRPARQ